MAGLKKPLVSVIIPTRNEAENIDECLKAMKSQSYKKIEIIVVDGNSVDSTVKIALENGAKVIYERPARGPANARNIGAKAAKGDIVFFVDADVFLKKNTIGRAIGFLEKNKIDAVIPLTWIYPTRKIIPQLYFAERLSSRMDLCPNFFRKDVFMKVKFDPSLGVGEDVDMRSRLDKLGVKIGFARRVITYHKEPDLSRLISEARWWGRTYLPLLKKKHLRVLASTIWIFAITSIIPLFILSQYFLLDWASFLLFLLLLLYLPYSIYKVIRAFRNGANAAYALLIPIFKIFKYSIFSFYILKGLFFRKNFRGR